MKRILISIAALFFCMGLSADNVFTVFRVTGEVQRKKISSIEWSPVHRRDTVKLSDKVFIPAGGEIRILESGNGLIHTLSVEGEFSVKEIIDKSKAATKGLLGAVSTELFSEAKGKISSAGSSFNTHGATLRGDESSEDAALRVLYNRILNGEEGLSLTLVPVGDTFRFQVDNSSGKSCLISIMGVHPGHASFCLPSSGIIACEGMTLLDAPEVFPAEDIKYLVFRITEPFDEGSLLRLFRSDSSVLN